jgi:signal transduction histidine kinase/ligand-binding sensor domain-containing protein
MKRIAILLVFILLRLSPNITAQKVLEPIVNPPQFKIHHVGYDKGLSSAFLETAYLDRFGFLWIGGQYGLDVYDGYTFKNVRMHMPDGTSSPIQYVYSIIEDDQGDIWFAGQKGIYWFDRSSDQIQVFTIDGMDPSDQLLRIYQDSKGFFWIYTSERLYMFDRKSLEFTPTEVQHNASFWAASILDNQLVEEENGTIWFPAYSQGVFKYDPSTGEFRNFRHDPDDPQSLSSDRVENIILDQDGSLWVATWNGGGLNRIVDKENGKFERYYHDPSQKNSIINDDLVCMLVDNTGSLWIAGRSGFSRYKKETNDFQTFQVPLRYYPYTSNWDHVVFTEIIEDPDGLLWFRGASHQGAYCFDPDNEILYRFLNMVDQEEGLHLSNWPFSIIPDNNGLVWIVTEEGINLLEKTINKPFYHFNHEINNHNSMNHPTVTSIYLDNHNTLWVGSHGGVLNRWDQFDRFSDADFRHYSPFEKLFSPELITSIAEDDNNILWLGTYSGIFKFDKSNQNFERFILKINDTIQLENALADEIYKDWNGNLWIGTRGRGTYLYNPEQDELNYLPPLGEDTIYQHLWSTMTFCEDQSGNMWLGHFLSGGITFFPASEVRRFLSGELPNFARYISDPDDPASLSASQVLQIHEDIHGRIWVGTTSGLNLFNPDNEAFISFGTDDNLPNDCISGILEDDNGNLWLSTLKGICKLELSEGISQNVIQSVKNYDLMDGIKGPVFHEKARFKSDDGWMFFGSFNGLTVFHPDSIKDNITIPPVHITNLKINDQPIFADDNIMLKKSLQETDRIKLSHKQNFLSFEYIALNYINAEGNRYKYRMEGLDEDWVDAGTRRFAEYRDLKPGEYTFRVIGSNDDGIWNEEGASIRIIIEPPWYRSILAYIIYFILLVVTVYIIVRWRTIRLRIENMKLDKMVKERTRTIEEQNEEIKATNVELEEQREEIMSTNTELEEQKEELEQQKEELQITLDQLKETQAQLIQSEKLAALGGLVAGVAHEINTPVGISLTAASSLEEETNKMAGLYKEDKLSRADFKDYLNTANQSAKLILSNMQRTAEMVQSFKQVSADQATEEQRRFKLKSYTDDVIRSLYPRLKNRRIHIDLDIDEKLEIDSFPGAFSQIITNLVLNSLTHGFDEEDEGMIEIKANLEKKKLNLDYSDNGKGIAPAHIDKIFEPFFTTNKKSGTGLGMHIVYNLVTQKLNGTIDCESKVNEGARFKIEIPI